jgi:chaperone modulatory protein CbpM
MISAQEFLIRARLEHHSLEAWIAAGWLIPPQTHPELAFSEVDLARAQLIRDLRDDLGVTDEGVSVILHLLDQVHGLRRSMQELLNAMRSGREGGEGLS